MPKVGTIVWPGFQWEPCVELLQSAIDSEGASEKGLALRELVLEVNLGCTSTVLR